MRFTPRHCEAHELAAAGDALYALARGDYAGAIAFADLARGWRALRVVAEMLDAMECKNKEKQDGTQL